MYLGKIVRSATGPAVRKPRHPYTVRCSRRCPLPERSPAPQASGTAAAIRLVGEWPSPLNPPPACRFHTRCWKAQEICRRRSRRWPNSPLATGLACTSRETPPISDRRASGLERPVLTRYRATGRSAAEAGCPELGQSALCCTSRTACSAAAGQSPAAAAARWPAQRHHPLPLGGEQIGFIRGVPQYLTSANTSAAAPRHLAAQPPDHQRVELHLEQSAGLVGLLGAPAVF